MTDSDWALTASGGAWGESVEFCDVGVCLGQDLGGYSNPELEPIDYRREMYFATEMHVSLVITGTDGAEPFQTLEQVLHSVAKSIVTSMKCNLRLAIGFGRNGDREGNGAAILGGVGRTPQTQALGGFRVEMEKACRRRSWTRQRISSPPAAAQARKSLL